MYGICNFENNRSCLALQRKKIRGTYNNIIILAGHPRSGCRLRGHKGYVISKIIGVVWRFNGKKSVGHIIIYYYIDIYFI